MANKTFGFWPRIMIILCFLSTAVGHSAGQEDIKTCQFLQIKGVFPEMAVIAGHDYPTEAGFGALLPCLNESFMMGSI